MIPKNINSEFNPKIWFYGYLARHRIIQGIEKHVFNMKGTMLDFGCGSKPYQSLFNVSSYVGLDYDGQGHNHENEQIDYFYDGTKIPFEDDFFDSVFSSEVFEHVFNLHIIIPEINRVMKKGALILITCPFAIAEHEVPADFARYSSFGLRYIMEENGFEVVTQEKLGNSIEVITQLLLSYLKTHFIEKLKKVPFLGSFFDAIISTFFNVFALCLGKIFFSGKELYLNNLILCKKK